MTSPCSGDSGAKHLRSSSPRFFFCSATSGSSAGSATVDAISVPNFASLRRRRADSAL
jgi:hypothetical protein